MRKTLLVPASLGLAAFAFFIAGLTEAAVRKRPRRREPKS